MSRKIRKSRWVESAAFVLYLCFFVSCATTYYPTYALYSNPDDASVKITTVNSRQFAVSKRTESIAIATYPDELNTHTPVGSFVPFFVKVINAGKNDVLFDPKTNISLYWTNSREFILDEAHRLPVWSRKDVVEYFRREKNKEEGWAALGAFNAALQGTMAAAHPENANLQMQAQLAGMNERLRQGIEGNPGDMYNEFVMNNDFLGINTISPKYQVNGQVWASQRIGKVDEDSNFIDYQGNGTKSLLMIVQTGRDTHQFVSFVESIKKVSHVSKAAAIIIPVLAIVAGAVIGILTRDPNKNYYI